MQMAPHLFEHALKLACKMEFNLGMVIASHLKHIVGVGKEHVAALFVGSHELMLTLLESCKSLFVVTFYPAGFVQADRLPTALSAIFMKKPVLNHLKL